VEIFWQRQKPVIKLPEGEYFQGVEAGKGLFGGGISKRPWRKNALSPEVPFTLYGFGIGDAIDM